MTPLTAYAVTLATFAAVDLVWIRLVMLPLFRAEVPHLLADRADSLAAAIFYAAFAAGLTWLVVLPAAEARALAPATVEGAAIGVMAYGALELTNKATLRGWRWRLVAADMAWGGFLSALAATAGTLAALRA